jgi:hypothetical protein
MSADNTARTIRQVDDLVDDPDHSETIQHSPDDAEVAEGLVRGAVGFPDEPSKRASAFSALPGYS